MRAITGLKNRNSSTLAPGPGAYAPNVYKNLNVSYSMGQKLSIGGISDSPTRYNPGAGAYEPKYKSDSKFRSDGFTKIGTSKRAGLYNEKNAKNFPSPDNYQQDAASIQKRAARFSFGTQPQRPKPNSYQRNMPGPGTYVLNPIVGTGSAKTLHSKLMPNFEMPGANKVPGPGTYEGRYSAMIRAEPSWKIGTSTRDD